MRAAPEENPPLVGSQGNLVEVRGCGVGRQENLW